MGIGDQDLQQILGNIFPYMIFFMMISSSVMIFTKSIIPKLVGLLGFIGLYLSNQSPNNRLKVDF